MNGRELAFCAHYAVHRSSEQAAIAAGYAPAWARKHSYEVLKRPHIQEQLNFLASRANELIALDAAVVLNDLGAIALTRPDEFLKVVDGEWIWKSPEELTERQRACVKNVRISTKKLDDGTERQEFRYTFKDAQGALYRLGDHFGIGDIVNPGDAANPFENLPQAELDRLTNAYEQAMAGAKQPELIEEGETVG